MLARRRGPLQPARAVSARGSSPRRRGPDGGAAGVVRDGRVGGLPVPGRWRAVRSAGRGDQGRLPVVPAAEASVLGNRELFGRLATGAMLAGMEDAWDDWGPELVLRDPTEYASAVLAARTRTPVAQVAISLAEVEAGSIAVAAPALEEHHQGLVSALRAQPYLTRFPASLDPSPFADTVRFHEPARSARLAAGLVGRVARAADLPDLRHGPGLHVDRRRDLRDGAEGGRANERAGAVDRGPPFDASTLGPVPANVHVEPWVDQARVLEQAELVVCHGGSGTTLAALAAGVPLVMVPLFADQFENARRVAPTRAGLVVEAQATPATPARSTAQRPDHRGHRGRARGCDLPRPGTRHRRRDGGHADRRGRPDTPAERAAVNDEARRPSSRRRTGPSAPPAG